MYFTSHKNYCYENTLIHKKKIIDFLGEDNYERSVNVCKTDIPIKRINFIMK